MAFWKTLARSPSLPGIILAIAVAVLEILVGDDE